MMVQLNNMNLLVISDDGKHKHIAFSNLTFFQPHYLLLIIENLSKKCLFWNIPLKPRTNKWRKGTHIWGRYANRAWNTFVSSTNTGKDWRIKFKRWYLNERKCVFINLWNVKKDVMASLRKYILPYLDLAVFAFKVNTFLQQYQNGFKSK